MQWCHPGETTVVQPRLETDRGDSWGAVAPDVRLSEAGAQRRDLSGPNLFD
jgi:hypothetical protein